MYETAKETLMYRSVWTLWERERVPLADYKKYFDLFDGDLYVEISIAACVNKRTSYGGTAVSCVEKQIETVREKLKA